MSGTRARTSSSSPIATAPGTASVARAVQVRAVSAMTPATSSGPANAPTWSRALCTANPRPRPTARAACASSADFDGLRIALPVRSSSTIVAPKASPAPPTKGATAISGTHTAVSPYPTIVSDQ